MESQVYQNHMKSNSVNGGEVVLKLTATIRVEEEGKGFMTCVLSCGDVSETRR